MHRDNDQCDLGCYAGVEFMSCASVSNSLCCHTAFGVPLLLLIDTNTLEKMGIQAICIFDLLG